MVNRFWRDVAEYQSDCDICGANRAVSSRKATGTVRVFLFSIFILFFSWAVQPELLYYNVVQPGGQHSRTGRIASCLAGATLLTHSMETITLVRVLGS